MPVRRMEVNFGPLRHDIPAHVFSLMHGHGFQWAITEDITVDRMHQIAFDKTIILCIYTTRISREHLDIVINIEAGVFIKDSIQTNQLTIDISWGTVDACHAPFGDDHRTNQ